MSEAVTISIVIVNWNAGRQLVQCISSVVEALKGDVESAEVIVVDNGSTDGSLGGIGQLGVAVRIIQNGGNRGFAYACNRGAAASNADLILFLNPDTRLFVDTLSVPLAYMRGNGSKGVGICGVRLINEVGADTISYMKFPTLRSFFFQALGLEKAFRLRSGAGYAAESIAPGVLKVDQMSGAFFMVRRAVFDQLNGFDERFFLYFEEVDFSLRASYCGWSSACLKNVTCIHIGGGTSRQVKAARLFYSLRSRILYAFKHFSRLSAFALLVITLGPEFLSRVLFASLSRSIASVRDTLEGYSMFVKEIPAFMPSAIRANRFRKSGGA